MSTSLRNPVSLPYKSAAVALLFCIFLGPLGLLYATFWGGLAMIAIGLVVMGSKFLLGVFGFWIICCIWAVKAVEIHNQKIYQAAIQQSF